MLGACQQAPKGAAPVTEAAAIKIAEQAESSFTTGDVAAIMNQYADSAVMIDASDPTPSTDRKVQTDWARNFASMQPAGYTVPDRHIQLLGPDAFISSGTESFTVGAGAARPTVTARFTDVFQRQKNGSWKIVNEHVSTPPTPAGKP
jgi:hypothetical protein